MKRLVLCTGAEIKFTVLYDEVYYLLTDLLLCYPEILTFLLLTRI